MAEPAPNDEPTAVLPIENKMFERPIEARGKGLIVPRSLAADRTRKAAKDQKKNES
jgi:hypothetical protein